jgi:hypothetical protein
MKSKLKSEALLPPAAADRGSGVRLAQTEDISIINRRARSTYPHEKSVRRSGATPRPILVIRFKGFPFLAICSPEHGHASNASTMQYGD